MLTFIFRKTLFISCVFVLLCTQVFGQASLQSIVPNSFPQGQSTDVVIRGVATNFKNGSTVVDMGSDVTITKTDVLNPETVIVGISVSGSASTGQKDLTVTTGSEVVTMVNAFELFAAGGGFKANIDVLPFQTASLSDFDISNPANLPLLFFVNLYNNNFNRDVKIEIDFSCAKYGAIGTLRIDSKILLPNEVARVSNRDFNHLDVVNGDQNTFLNIVKLTGVLPPDEYFYTLHVTEGTTEIATDNASSVITNPLANPILIGPGVLYAADVVIFDDAQISKIVTPNPLFQWVGQANKYDLSVYKIISGQSPQDVLNNIPVFKQTDVQGNNFVYPSSAEKFVDGEAYAWQVVAKVVSASGTVEYPSELFAFVYSTSLNNPDPGAAVKIMVSPQQIDMSSGATLVFTAKVFDANNHLIEGLTPTWEVLPANGTIDENGAFKAGTQNGTVAVVARLGNLIDFGSVNITNNQAVMIVDEGQWMVDGMIRQLFGLNNEGH